MSDVVKATSTEHGGGTHADATEKTLMSTRWRPGAAGYLGTDTSPYLELTDDVLPDNTPDGVRRYNEDRMDVVKEGSILNYSLDSLPRDLDITLLADEGVPIIDEGSYLTP